MSFTASDFTPPSEIAYAHGCGATHTHAGWSRLPLAYLETRGHAVMESRTCPCGSTLACAWCCACGAQVRDPDAPCPGCGADLWGDP